MGVTRFPIVRARPGYATSPYRSNRMCIEFSFATIPNCGRKVKHEFASAAAFLYEVFFSRKRPKYSAFSALLSLSSRLTASMKSFVLSSLKKLRVERRPDFHSVLGCQRLVSRSISGSTSAAHSLITCRAMLSASPLSSRITQRSATSLRNLGLFRKDWMMEFIWFPPYTVSPKLGVLLSRAMSKS